MSLAATCPKCSTMFRVVADQLKLHQGAVRCGSCGTVFNAAERLAYVPDGSIANRRLTQPAALRTSGPVRPIVPSGAAGYTAGGIASVPVETSVQQASGDDSPGYESAAIEKSNSAAEEASADRPAPVQDAALSKSTPAPEQTVEAPANFPIAGPEQDASAIGTIEELLEYPEVSLPAAADRTPVTSLTPDVEVPSYRPNAPTSDVPDFSATTDLASAFLEREALAARAMRRSRLLALSGVIVAAIALSAQSAYWWRNELASALPGSKPWLTALCRSLNCSVELPAHGDKLALDSLQIAQASGATRYQVSLIIRNQSTLQQRAPYLELTLTSANGDAIMRRAIAPQEWLPATVANGGLQPMAELPVRFALSADQPFTGFTGRLVFAPAP